MDWSRPSPKMWLARLTLLGGLTLLGVLAGGAIAAFSGGVGGLVLIGVAVVLGGSALVVSRRRYRSWGYLEREDDLLVTRGVMVKRLTVVPYGRMQFIDVTAGPIDRVFGLSTVQLHTAAAATDARIPGLLATDAQRLRDQLASLGEARAAGL